MMEQIKWDIVQRIFRIRPEEYSAAAIEEIEREKEKELDELQLGGQGGPGAEPAQPSVVRFQKLGAMNHALVVPARNINIVVVSNLYIVSFLLSFLNFNWMLIR
jgi:hypothetical protein